MSVVDLSNEQLFDFQTYLSGKYPIGNKQFGGWTPVLDIRPIWEEYSGDGVTIAVDMPVDRLHPELRPNYDTSDLGLYDPLGELVAGSNFLGTAFAGLAAAEAGDGGMVGVAPGASIQSHEGVLSGSADIIIAHPGITQYEEGFDGWFLVPVSNVFTRSPYAGMMDGRNGLGQIIVTANPLTSWNTDQYGVTPNSEYGLHSQRNVISTNALTIETTVARVDSSLANVTSPEVSGTSYVPGGGMTLVSVPIDTASYVPYWYVDGTLPPDVIANIVNPWLSVINYRDTGQTPNVLVPDPRGSLGIENPASLSPWEALIENLLAQNPGIWAGEPADFVDTANYTTAINPELSAGVAAGVVALMLEANPDLGWRDVTEILAYSARFDSLQTLPNEEDSRWVINAASDWNLGGHYFDPVYGFGSIDALGAVRLAETWEASSTSANEIALAATPEFTLASGGDYIDFTWADRYQTWDSSRGGLVWVTIPAYTEEPYRFTADEDLRIEHVGVHVRFAHDLFSNIDGTGLGEQSNFAIEIESPNGLLSRVSGDSTVYDGTEAWIDFEFTTRAFWGENAAEGDGEWTVWFRDIGGLASSSYAASFTVADVDLTFYGSEASEDNTYIFNDDFDNVQAFGYRHMLLDDAAGANTVNAAAVHFDLQLTTEAGSTASAGGSKLYEVAAGSVISHLVAGDGNDLLIGAGRSETLDGWRGDDTLFGGAGNDFLNAGIGTNRIDGGSGTDTAVYEGKRAEYRIVTVPGALSVSGTGVDDILTGIEYLSFSDGRISAPSFEDPQFGSVGSDDLRAGEGAFQSGLTGNDRLLGSAHSDALYGGDGDDKLYAFGGPDRLYGDAGNDRLYDRTGDSPEIYGGAGNDIAYGAGALYFDGGDGKDILFGRAGGDVAYGGGDRDAFRGMDGDDRLYGGVSNDRLYGDAGNDFLAGGDDVDRIYGGAGTDTLSGGDRNDILVGGADDDWLDGGFWNDRCYGGEGKDTVVGGDGDDTIYGGAGDDEIHGNDRHDFILGDEGKDSLFGGTGADKLYGGTEDDTLSGGDGDDLLFGGDGADSLHGGSGSDRLEGGLGADTFVFAPSDGRDRIVNFEAGIDRIDITAFGFTRLADVTAGMSEADGKVYLTYGGDVIVVEGVSLTAVESAILY